MARNAIRSNDHYTLSRVAKIMALKDALAITHQQLNRHLGRMPTLALDHPLVNDYPRAVCR